MKMPLYLDYAATTPVDPLVAESMMECLTMEGVFANPASRAHIYGWQAEELVETSREQVAQLINADPREIIWTSGATESNNLAIKGALSQLMSQNPDNVHIVTSEIEHKAVLDTVAELELRGCHVTRIKPSQTGIITLEDVINAVTENTSLVSLMQVNNEIGSISDIANIGKYCREQGILFHVDAAQSVGKIPVDVKALSVDLLSLSAHKLYGPKGVGALYVRRHPDVSIKAQIHGGGHERGMRSGTLPTHQIVGMGKACELASCQLHEEYQRLTELKQQMLKGISELSDVMINGCLTQSVPGILNCSIGYVEGESLLMGLKNLAVSSGSACTSASLEPSHVLTSLNVPDDLAHASVRFSFGRYTTKDDIVSAIEQVIDAVTKLRALSPEWRYKNDF